ncbi:uncharacterized protein LOC125944152 [Dermacentor silvarum]|uniref:uncharacterized protein LOC125944152 n=1 Tax=Dermacentor silvarum TaxID=543639 RepID=UPI0021008D3D|nr:uncharacterized protein LOC125944152 [Dermacentor silvarum]
MPPSRLPSLSKPELPHSDPFFNGPMHRPLLRTTKEKGEDCSKARGLKSRHSLAARTGARPGHLSACSARAEIVRRLPSAHGSIPKLRLPRQSLSGYVNRHCSKAPQEKEAEAQAVIRLDEPGFQYLAVQHEGKSHGAHRTVSISTRRNARQVGPVSPPSMQRTPRMMDGCSPVPCNPRCL